MCMVKCTNGQEDSVFFLYAFMCGYIYIYIYMYGKMYLRARRRHTYSTHRRYADLELVRAYSAVQPPHGHVSSPAI